MLPVRCAFVAQPHADALPVARGALHIAPNVCSLFAGIVGDTSLHGFCTRPVGQLCVGGRGPCVPAPTFSRDDSRLRCVPVRVEAVTLTATELEKQLQNAVWQKQSARALGLYDQLRQMDVLPASDAAEGLLKLLSGKGSFPPAWSIYKTYEANGCLFQYRTLQALLSVAIKVQEPYAAYAVFTSFERCGLTPNKVTYCSVISALCRAARKGVSHGQVAYRLWQQLHGSTEHVLDDAAYRTGINACVTVGRLDEAAALLEEMVAQGHAADARAYNILIKGYSAEGRLDLLEAALQAMNAARVKPTGVTYNSVIAAYVRAGDISKVGKALQAAEKDGIVLDVWSYTTLIKGYVQAGDLDAALGVARDMAQHGVPRNNVTVATLVDGYVRAGDVEGARALLQEARGAGLRLEAVTYNTLLRGYAERSRRGGGGSGGGGGNTEAWRRLDCVQEAFAVLQEMSRESVRPDVQTFNTLMDTCVEGGQPARGVQVFGLLKRMGRRPDTLSYTTLIKALARLERYDEAERVLQAMQADKAVQVDAAALSAMVDCYCRAGRMADAQEMVQQATALAAENGERAPVRAWGAVIASQSRALDLDGALESVRAFYAAGGEPDTAMFDALVDCCVRTGEFKKALQVVRAMERCGKVADKARIKRLFTELYRGQQRASASFRRARRRRSLQLERFKFWLGLPNAYYNEEEVEEEEEELVEVEEEEEYCEGEWQG